MQAHAFGRGAPVACWAVELALNNRAPRRQLGGDIEITGEEKVEGK